MKRDHRDWFDKLLEVKKLVLKGFKNFNAEILPSIEHDIANIWWDESLDALRKETFFTKNKTSLYRFMNLLGRLNARTKEILEDSRLLKDLEDFTGNMKYVQELERLKHHLEYEDKLTAVYIEIINQVFDEKEKGIMGGADFLRMTEEWKTWFKAFPKLIRIVENGINESINIKQIIVELEELEEEFEKLDVNNNMNDIKKIKAGLEELTKKTSLHSKYIKLIIKHILLIIYDEHDDLRNIWETWALRIRNPKYYGALVELIKHVIIALYKVSPSTYNQHINKIRTDAEHVLVKRIDSKWILAMAIIKALLEFRPTHKIELVDAMMAALHGFREVIRKEKFGLPEWRIAPGYEDWLKQIEDIFERLIKDPGCHDELKEQFRTYLANYNPNEDFPDYPIKIFAIQTLGKLIDKQSADLIKRIALRKSEDKQVREAALQALRSIGMDKKELQIIVQAIAIVSGGEGVAPTPVKPPTPAPPAPTPQPPTPPTPTPPKPVFKKKDVPAVRMMPFPANEGALIGHALDEDEDRRKKVGYTKKKLSDVRSTLTTALRTINKHNELKIKAEQITAKQFDEKEMALETSRLGYALSEEVGKMLKKSDYWKKDMNLFEIEKALENYRKKLMKDWKKYEKIVNELAEEVRNRPGRNTFKAKYPPEEPWEGFKEVRDGDRLLVARKWKTFGQMNTAIIKRTGLETGLIIEWFKNWNECAKCVALANLMIKKIRV